MAESDIENTMDSNAIGVVVQCRCSACGGCGMLPGTEPDHDVMNTPCPQCNPWAKAKTSRHEPAIAVHNVFSQAIPGAFGLPFLRRLLNKPNDKAEALSLSEVDPPAAGSATVAQDSRI